MEANTIMNYDKYSPCWADAGKMKRLFTIVIIIALIFAFVACKRSSDFETIIVPKGKTEAGTWIIDHEQSKISKRDFYIIDTDESEAFSEIGYCSEYELLYVRFRNSGQTYVYTGFDEYDWKQFQRAPSLGGWFNQNIKGQYSCYRW